MGNAEAKCPEDPHDAKNAVFRQTGCKDAESYRKVSFRYDCKQSLNFVWFDSMAMGK